jgi:uncharacterized FlaG/YvyC family protein
MEVHPTNGVPVIAEVANPLPGDQASVNRDIVRAIHAVNASEMFGSDEELTFYVDPRSKRVIVRLVKRNSGEVVRQIPADYVLELARRNGEDSADLLLPADEGI